MGANHDAKTKKGRTAATLAASKGHKKIVKYLKENPTMNPIQVQYLAIKNRASLNWQVTDSTSFYSIDDYLHRHLLCYENKTLVL